MGILSFLRPPPQPHPEFGPFQYSGGQWRGTIALENGARIPLLLPGSRGGPHPDGLRLAERVPAWWAQARPDVESELYAHHSAEHEDDGRGATSLSAPANVWPLVVLSSVQVKPYRSLNEFQVAIRTRWDEEHTLGALIRDGKLVELNGSILEPR